MGLLHLNDDLGLWDNCFRRRACAAYPNTQATLKVVSSCIACNVAGWSRVQHRLHTSTRVVNRIGRDIPLNRFQS